MPTNYLNQLAAYNQRQGITSTFSEMKKTARRMEKLHIATGLPVDVEAYFLDYSDEVGETATDNVYAEQNRINAARRLGRAA